MDLFSFNNTPKSKWQMKYATVCSGIGAPKVAWRDMWGEPVFTSEIEKFPSTVLKHHMPSVPNYGDMTKYKGWPNHDIELICGGTPCQSFSIAGLRKGMDDPRGNLALVYLGIINRYKPRWVIWENVPGVLSSSGGRDFSAFISALAELGYSCAWRVLNAQFFGVPQRRRRVFIVGHLGADWRPPFAVLFESSTNRSVPAPRRKARREGVYYVSQHASGIESGNIVTDSTGTLTKRNSNRQVLMRCGEKFRFLTPKECERLQGFPDNYTRIPWRGKNADQCPDGPRYKALGNSMAVPVLEWIGRRIQLWENLK